MQVRRRMVALVGPERVELVKSVRKAMADTNVPHLLPNSVTLEELPADASSVVVRPAPAAEFIGCALANWREDRKLADLHRNIVMMIEIPKAARHPAAA